MHKSYYWLAASALLIVGCPKPPQFQPGPTGLYAGATPAPSTSASVLTVSGTLYSEETGQPVPTAIVLLDGGTYALSKSDGSFTATRSSAVKSPTVSVLKSGYANLTVHGYEGGPLSILPRVLPAAPATSSVTIRLVAPAGVATSSAVGVAVQRDGYAYADRRYTKTVPLSSAGTGSVTLDLPAGLATIAAVGRKAPIAGHFQGPVAPEMTVNLTETAPLDTYETEVPPLRTDGTVTSIVSYYLNWPGQTPAQTNQVLLSAAVGDSGGAPVSLPPVSAFGLTGAYYSVEGYAIASTTSVSVSAMVVKPRITPGHRLLPLLSEPVMPYYRTGSEKYNVPMLLHVETPVSGANAYTADLTTYASPVERVWRVISLGAGTESLVVPVLPSELRPTFGLTANTKYGVLLRADLNPTTPGGDQATTLGTVASVTYNMPIDSTAWKVLSLGPATPQR